MVDFRRPDQRAHRADVGLAPHHHRLRFRQTEKSVGAAQLQAVIFGHRGDKVVAILMA